MDTYSMSLGKHRTAEEWEMRIQKYKGQPVFPEVPYVDAGREDSNLQIRVLTWRTPAWLQLQTALNSACATIMTAAIHDERIMPVRGYKQLRHAFSHCKKHDLYKGCAAVLSLKQLRQQRLRTWQMCLTSVKSASLGSILENSCFSWGDVGPYKKHRLYYKFLCDVHIGMVCPYGSVVQPLPGSAKWDRQSTSLWKRSTSWKTLFGNCVLGIETDKQAVMMYA